MSIILPALQLIVAIGLLNVWLLRFNNRTAYRGGSAATMPEEFAAYGLPAGSVYVVGGLKVGVALAMIAGLWFPVVVVPAAALLAALMLGAIAMHFKIRDPLQKSLPALLMLALAVTIAIGSPR
jgi:DoxX-like family